MVNWHWCDARLTAPRLAYALCTLSMLRSGRRPGVACRRADVTGSSLAWVVAGAQIGMVVVDTCPYFQNKVWCPSGGDPNNQGFRNHLDVRAPVAT